MKPQVRRRGSRRRKPSGRAIEAKKDQPKEGVAWIKETLGMDLNPGAFSTLKNPVEVC